LTNTIATRHGTLSKYFSLNSTEPPGAPWPASLGSWRAGKSTCARMRVTTYLPSRGIFTGVGRGYEAKQCQDDQNVRKPDVRVHRSRMRVR